MDLLCCVVATDVQDIPQAALLTDQRPNDYYPKKATALEMLSAVASSRWYQQASTMASPQTGEKKPLQTSDFMRLVSKMEEDQDQQRPGCHTSNQHRSGNSSMKKSEESWNRGIIGPPPTSSGRGADISRSPPPAPLLLLRNPWAASIQCRSPAACGPERVADSATIAIAAPLTANDRVPALPWYDDGDHGARAIPAKAMVAGGTYSSVEWCRRNRPLVATSALQVSPPPPSAHLARGTSDSLVWSMPPAKPSLWDRSRDGYWSISGAMAHNQQPIWR